jgi:hypothetical protein
MSDAPEVKPARPRKLSFRFAREDDRLALRFGRRPSGAGCFLLLWLTVWTVGCVFLAGMVIKEPKVFSLLFAIPFWASWILVFCILLNQFFNREYILLDARGLSFERRVLIRLSSRRLPLEEIQSLESYQKNMQQEGQPPPEGIETRTLGQPLRFGEFKSDEEKAWLLDQLNDHLGFLQNGRSDRINKLPARIAPPDIRGNSGADQPHDPEPVPEGRGLALKLSSLPVAPPSDCRWTREDDFDEISFLQKGKFSPSGLGGLLFVNLFWNGIVSVFVGVLLGFAPMQNPIPTVAWWGLFVFLIPFEVIGALMFLALIAQLLEPFRRTRWNFGRGEIESRCDWFGIGFRRRYEFLGLDRLEIGVARKKQGFSPASGTGPTHRLALIDGENVELCALKNLTEGEARWIGDAILRERPLWFSSSRSA